MPARIAVLEVDRKAPLPRHVIAALDIHERIGRLVNPHPDVDSGRNAGGDELLKAAEPAEVARLLGPRIAEKVISQLKKEEIQP